MGSGMVGAPPINLSADRKLVPLWALCRPLSGAIRAAARSCGVPVAIVPGVPSAQTDKAVAAVPIVPITEPVDSLPPSRPRRVMDTRPTNLRWHGVLLAGLVALSGGCYHTKELVVPPPEGAVPTELNPVTL